MKLLFTLIMLSSMLFSMQTQKQIILGSYSVNTNGINAVAILNKQIEDDKKIKEFMKNHSLQTMNTVISGYTVVCVNTFETYESLFQAMELFKTYYNDAYVLKYPTKNMLKKETFVEVKEKADEEQIIENNAQQVKLAQHARVEDARNRILEKKRLSQELAKRKAKEIKDKTLQKETIQEEKLQEENMQEARLVEEKHLAQELAELQSKKLEEVKQEVEEPVNIQTNESVDDRGLNWSDYYLLIALVILILVIGAVVMFKQMNPKDDDTES